MIHGTVHNYSRNFTFVYSGFHAYRHPAAIYLNKMPGVSGDVLISNVTVF
jgi:hypothetical protein